MAHGGSRPNAGRPKKGEEPIQVEVRRGTGKYLTPLEYMEAVINDDDADVNRRDRMAVAAAPYRHPRASEVEPGKKERRQANAVKAAAEGRFSEPVTPKLIVNNR